MLIKNHFKEYHLFTRRTVVLIVGLLLLLSVLIGRLVYLQVLEHDRYTTLSNRNQMTVLPIAPNRGLIYDRNNVLLSENVPVFNLEITPDRSEDLEKTLTELNQLIPIDEQNLAAFHKIRKQSRNFESIPLKNNLTEEEVAAFYVNQQLFPGVTVNARLMRHYPLGEAFANILGYVGRMNSQDLNEIDRNNYQIADYIGKTGVEKAFEAELHGKSGFQQAEVNASGRIIRILTETPSIHGDDIHLTIDSKLQKAALGALEDEVGAVIVLDPRNGEILAMASNPSYDPNLFVKGISSTEYTALQNRKDQPLFNRSIQGQYPIGSTIKPFLALAGLKKGAITKNTTVQDKGWFKLPNSDHVFRDWRRRGHGLVNLTTAIIVSCDVFFYELAPKLGITYMAQMLTQFGFGQKTGIELNSELTGIVPTPDWKRGRFNEAWYTGDTVNAGIGQGFVLATPLQLAAATATLAMRGLQYRPHLLLKKENQHSISISQPVITKQVKAIAEQHWNTVTKAMQGVINSDRPHGTGFKYGRNPPYSIAAKTGTSEYDKPEKYKDKPQKMIPRKYRDTSVFIAFAPVEAPKIAVAVVVEHNGIFAQMVARKVIDQYLLAPTPTPQTQ